MRSTSSRIRRAAVVALDPVRARLLAELAAAPASAADGRRSCRAHPAEGELPPAHARGARAGRAGRGPDARRDLRAHAARDVGDATSSRRPRSPTAAPSPEQVGDRLSARYLDLARRPHRARGRHAGPQGGRCRPAVADVHARHRGPLPIGRRPRRVRRRARPPPCSTWPPATTTTTGGLTASSSPPTRSPAPAMSPSRLVRQTTDQPRGAPMTTPDIPHRFELELAVPGTPEQVWHAIAIAEGISAWMMPDRARPPGGRRRDVPHGPGRDVRAAGSRRSSRRGASPTRRTGRRSSAARAPTSRHSSPSSSSRRARAGRASCAS